jgi:hypothetical protein
VDISLYPQRFLSEKREILSVIDTGLSLLRTIRSIPHKINFVSNPGIRLFEDSDGQRPRNDVNGLILDTQSPGGMEKRKRIFPTTRIDYYQVGKRVSWEWNLEKHWGETWYKDLDTKEFRLAWSKSIEFVGRHFDEL